MKMFQTNVKFVCLALHATRKRHSVMVIAVNNGVKLLQENMVPHAFRVLLPSHAKQNLLL